MQRFLDAIKNIWSPHEGQLKFLLNTAKRKVLACGRRWGKSDACAIQILETLEHERPSKHLIFAPTQDQAGIVLRRIAELLEDRTGKVIKIVNDPFPTIRIGKHVVTARSGKILSNLRGHEATHILVDEAAFTTEELITEVAMPMLATTDGYLTLVSTPYGKNHFWRFYKMGEDKQNDFWSHHGPSCESPRVSKSFLEVQRALISERAFAIEYDASFLDSTSQVFKQEAVDRCKIDKLPVLNEPFVVGVDWARYGDYTAVAVLSGHRDKAWLAEITRFNGVTWTEAVNRVADIIRHYPNAIVTCDASGVGDPVLEQLQEALPRISIEGLVFTNSVKGSLIDNLAWLIDRSALKMEPHPDLLKELDYFQAEMTTAGNTKLNAKVGYHDDLVVSLALAASRLTPSLRPQIAVGKQRKF